MNQKYSVIFLLAFSVAAHPLSSDGAIFTDDFNRPDSPSIGNGWLDATTSSDGRNTGTFEILNNAATFTGTEPADLTEAGIYRAANFSGEFTVDLTITQESGYGGLPNRYGDSIWILNDGVIGHGYGLRFSRGDQNFPSYVELINGTTVLEALTTSFQYGSKINTHFTFSSDGSVTGSVSEGADNFDFSFAPRQIQASGSYFMYSTTAAGYPTSDYIFPSLDDISLTTTSIPEPNSGVVTAGVLLAVACLRRPARKGGCSHFTFARKGI